MITKEKKILLFSVYYCRKCDRFTDVNYVADKFGGRKKSYCYKCSEEMLEPVKVIMNG
ncbi:MAG: hypothetical protein AABY22_31725 [Nanoarchaeota archaeon]